MRVSLLCYLPVYKTLTDKADKSQPSTYNVECKGKQLFHAQSADTSPEMFNAPRFLQVVCGLVLTGGLISGKILLPVRPVAGE